MQRVDLNHWPSGYEPNEIDQTSLLCNKTLINLHKTATLLLCNKQLIGRSYRGRTYDTCRVKAVLYHWAKLLNLLTLE